MMAMIMMMTIMMSGTECDVYKAVAEYVTILTTTEVATCNAHTVSLAGQQKLIFFPQILEKSNSHRMSVIVMPLILVFRYQGSDRKRI